MQGAGYLLDKQFLAHYIQDPIKYPYPVSYHNGDEVWKAHQVSCEQIKYDKEFFYGILVTTCRNISNKTIIKHAQDRDGIMAWLELRKDLTMMDLQS